MGLLPFLTTVARTLTPIRTGMLQGEQAADSVNRQRGIDDQNRALATAKTMSELSRSALEQHLLGYQLDPSSDPRRAVKRQHYIDAGIDPKAADAAIDDPTLATEFLKPRTTPKDILLQKRIQQLVTGGTPLDKANTQARLELGEAPGPPDPMTVHRSNRDYDLAHPLPVRAATPGEDPETTATRKDLRGIQGQQVRAEHDLTAAKGDQRAFTSRVGLGRADRASLPLPELKTAADSAAHNELAGITSAIADAEKRKGTLTQKADSIQGVLDHRRAGDAGGAPALAPGGETAPPAGSAGPVVPPHGSAGDPLAAMTPRFTQEAEDYKNAVAAIKAKYTGSALVAKLQQAQAIYNGRVAKIANGVDPDQTPDGGEQ